MGILYPHNVVASIPLWAYFTRMVLPVQSKMARAALGWSVRDLAREASVGVNTVVRFEAGQVQPIAATLAAIQRAFEAAGIIFIEQDDGGPGVRLATPIQ